MSLITAQMEGYIQTQSWIRRMFEAAAELKAKYGADNVFDFSLGNPDVPPPSTVKKAIHDIADTADQPLSLGYCPNAGRPNVRAALADVIAGEQQTDVQAEQVIVTSGAAGALNTVFRTILERDDELVVSAPYFVEYGFYAGNYGGVLKAVPSDPKTFALDIPAIEKALNSKTRAVIINSPNNPAGVVYSKNELEALAQVLTSKSKEFGKPIFLISDEPYRFMAYDGVEVPPVLPLYPYSIVINSFSKSLSLAGVRIGYIAVNPEMPDKEMLINGFILANRILGFVNAPVIGQQIILRALTTKVDTAIYDERRQAMASILDEIGIEYHMPQGAFYFFPRVPDGYSDQEFVDLLLSENICAVPGKGFGAPGYIRLSYCVDKKIIDASRPAFKRVMEKLDR